MKVIGAGVPLISRVRFPVTFALMLVEKENKNGK